MKTKKDLAVAVCRVSSYEQLKSDSLKHQKENVLEAARQLGVTIPHDGVWQGYVSSKTGVNFNRKDLLSIAEYCRLHPRVGYLIIQEVDRFMRSPDEQTYWIVRFWHEFGVKVWFADKPRLNDDTHDARLFRYMEGWSLEGTNEERMRKSINGQTAAIRDGRYPFNPKPGYMKGRLKGIPEVHEVRGPILKRILFRVASKVITPPEGLIELNNSDFMNNHAPYKMDKFRKILTDPFYAGIIEIDKQVQARSERGLHEPLISLMQHQQLVHIMNEWPKNQKGPAVAGNPKYPLSNFVTCQKCIGQKNCRFVGFDHSNGKGKGALYEKYRCRSCGKYITRQQLHDLVTSAIQEYFLTDEAKQKLITELSRLWSKQETRYEEDIKALQKEITDLGMTIQSQVEAAIDPSNAFIKADIMAVVDKNKQRVKQHEEELAILEQRLGEDRQKFMVYALDFVDELSRKYLELSKTNRKRCTLLLFPEGIQLTREEKVHIPKISPFYTLKTTKKDAETSNLVQMVRVRGL